MSNTGAPAPAWDMYDCLQANLALLADGGTALGARLGFAPGPGADGLPTVEPALDDHLEAARELLGLGTVDRRTLGPRPSPAELLDDHRTVYVVADAYHLPWVPYRGHRHMEHSFLLESADGMATVRDAYHNDTPWGPARPGSWQFDPGTLAEALPDGCLVLAFTHTAAAVPSVEYRAPAASAVAEYLRAYREHADRAQALERLMLETWLLFRARRLHAACRGTDTGPDTETGAHLAEWARLAEQTYLAHRRVERGRPEPTGPLDRLAQLLAADAAVFGGGAALREQVAAEAGAALRVPASVLLDGAELRSLPAFSSFRMIEIVERLEDRFHVEVSPDDLVPENLRDLDALCRTVTRAREES